MARASDASASGDPGSSEGRQVRITSYNVCYTKLLRDRLASERPGFKAEARLAKGREKCWTGASIEGERFFPAWLYSPEDDFVARTLAGLRSAGLTPELSHYAFCTNGSHYAGEAGIKTMGYGPSLETLAHTIDEYIAVEQLAKALTGYAAIASALLV